MLDKWEKLAFDNCLGFDLYDLLISDLETYTTVDFVDTLTLVNGNYYEFEGCVFLYQNVEAITGVDSPGCSDNWTVANKFSSDCYNSLWENGLRDYLASYLHLRVLPFSKKILYDNVNERQNSRFDFQLYNQDIKDLTVEISDCIKLLESWIVDDHNDEETNCDWTMTDLIDNCLGCEDSNESFQRIAFLD
jgi:hypothetical protein